jgi:hypothetical protein
MYILKTRWCCYRNQLVNLFNFVSTTKSIIFQDLYSKNEELFRFNFRKF